MTVSYERPAVLRQRPDPLSIDGVAGQPFGYVVNLISAIPVSEITNPVVIVKGEDGVELQLLEPTITFPVDGQWFISWDAEQTGMMPHFGEVSWGLSALVQSAGPNSFLAGRIRMSDPTDPGAFQSTTTTSDLTVEINAFVVNLEVFASGGGGFSVVEEGADITVAINGPVMTISVTPDSFDTFGAAASAEAAAIATAEAFATTAVAGEATIARAAELVLTTAVDNGFNPTIVNSGGLFYELPDAQWAIDSSGNAYWLNGGSVPNGYTPAVLGPDGFLYPMESTAPPFDLSGTAAAAVEVEATRAESAEGSISSALSSEIARAEAGEAAAILTAEGFTTAAVATEATARNAAIGVETSRAEASETALALVLDNGFNPTVTAIAAAGPLVTLPAPQWAFDSFGNPYWLNGNSLPTGYTAAALGPDLILYPIGVPA